MGQGPFFFSSPPLFSPSFPFSFSYTLFFFFRFLSTLLLFFLSLNTFSLFPFSISIKHQKSAPFRGHKGMPPGALPRAVAGPYRALQPLRCEGRTYGGDGLAWVGGLVEFDVDRPRSRATDGNSVNATRKTPNRTVSRHERSLFGRAMAKMTTVVRYGPGHDTHHRSHWQSALLFSVLGDRGAL